jgi:hypothetical protein
MPILNTRNVSFITRTLCLIFSFLILLGIQIPVSANKALQTNIKSLSANKINTQINSTINTQALDNFRAQVLVCIPLPGGGVVCF